MSATATAPAATSIPLPIGRLVGVGAVVFFANAALLVLQLVAGRLLAPFIGSSLETWTSIIGVFLAGIALGNGFGGKLADRYPTPRTLAALLAVGSVAALWMLVFPMLLASVGVHKTLPLGPRIPILAAVLCLPAGFVLSLLTPLAIKLGLPDVGHTGRVAGLIFALSTLGCLIGNYVTGFYLIPTFTTNMLVVVSAGALLALAGASLVLVKPNAAAHPTGAESNGPAAPPDAPSAQNPHAFTDIRQAYLIVFLASFCGMTLELTASRVLAQALGVSLFTWTGIIGVMLAGTALGNFTGGVIADRPRVGLAWLVGAMVFLGGGAGAGALALLRAYDRDRPVVEYVLGVPPRNWAKYQALSNDEYALHKSEIDAFYEQALPVLLPQLRSALAVGVLVGVALGAVLASVVIGVMRRRPAEVPLNPRVPLAATLILAGAATVFLFVTMALITRYHLFDTWGAIPQVMAWTFGMFFLPMFALGLVSPQVIRLAVPDLAHVGRVAGRVYAWSTVGAIVGTFAAGYVLLSALGMHHTILVAAVVLTLTSLLVVNIWGETRAAIKAPDTATGYNAAGSGVLLYLFSVVLGGITGGFILTTRDRSDEYVRQVESNYYTIKVGRYPTDGHEAALSLNLDRLLHSVVDPYDPYYLYYTHEHVQIEFMRLAQATSTEPRALVIGGGGYTFPRYALEILPRAHVDVVEIDPKVTQVARDSLGLKDYANLRAVHMDGRQFVSERVTPGSYDLVIQDAVNDLSVPAHLMTKEYNDAVKAALKPGGAYLLTIIDSISDGKLWKAAMATLAHTFPAENVVLLTAEAISPSGTEAGDYWDRTRRVLVIYASDKPLDVAALRAAVVDQLAPPFAVGAALGAGTRGDFATFPLIAASESLARRGVPFHTIPVPPDRLKRFTDLEPGVVLTDQYCPVDNLMAEVFRNRNK
jgi:predicted membrane-bound spermidine synthase